MNEQFENIYKAKTVLVTGHTGFKGSWLCLWLIEMGAEVIGYSIDIPTSPSHYELLNLDMTSIFGDIKDINKLKEVFGKYQPEMVFHLAAQPLVRESYRSPAVTFETNIMGTVNIFEASRSCDSVRAIINVTSDKAYENKEWIWGYRESDPMGGYDPYSASKGCSELITASYRNSFFNLDEYGKSHSTLVASCRAGNVIGGGDWAEDRLIPDMIRAIESHQKVVIRNPHAIRPWQHVLEPLHGYLLVGKKLLEGKKEFAEAWNFGPDDNDIITVEHVAKNIQKIWNQLDYTVHNDKYDLHEALFLKLDCSKAHSKLNWSTKWNSNRTFEQTILWYKVFFETKKVNSKEQLKEYIEYAKK